MRRPRWPNGCGDITAWSCEWRRSRRHSYDRSYDPQASLLLLSDLLRRESRGFHMAFQLS